MVNLCTEVQKACPLKHLNHHLCQLQVGGEKFVSGELAEKKSRGPLLSMKYWLFKNGILK